MTKTPDPESIAKAMRDAAWIATHGTREQRSGKFSTPTAPTEVATPPKEERGRSALSAGRPRPTR